MKKLNKTRVSFAVAILFGIIFLVVRGIVILLSSESIPTENSCQFNSRVKVAACEKREMLENILSKENIDWNQLELFIRAFKLEQTVEVWGKNQNNTDFKLITSYPFCVLSGALGPKRKEGDLQVPEGIYYIDRFNPVSSYYLSLGINYPNKSDKKRGHKKQPGGDIFIHGKCASIGCIPITDDKIKELYILANQAKLNGQSKVPIHIFPTKMTRRNLSKIKRDFPDHTRLWNELQKIFVDFEEHYHKQKIEIDDAGNYILREHENVL